MSDLRDLQMLVSLSRIRNFSRAASECNISQPAFSTRIRKLEERLNLALVRRGNSFQGFTTEGEVVLKWARKLLADEVMNYKKLIDFFHKKTDDAKNKVSLLFSVKVI